MSIRKLAAFAVAVTFLLACKTPASNVAALKDDTNPPVAAAQAGLDQTFQRLGIRFVQVPKIDVDVENTTSYASKIALVRSATSSIDIAYFLYGDDYAGSYLAKELLAKAASGVKVRMMVDAKTTLKHRTFFKMLVEKGGGNLAVSYFRPVPQVILDDFKKLGLDAGEFVGALAAMDTAAVAKQIEASPVLRQHAALMKEVKTLVRLISQPGQPEVPNDKTIAEGLALVANLGPLDAIDKLTDQRVSSALARVKEAHRQIQLSASGKDWFDLTKWTHHKLLLIDGQRFQGGGRNLEDAYHWEKDHVVRVADNKSKYVFMDVDFVVDSEEIGRDALATYDKYLEGSCYAEPPLPATCASQIPMGREAGGGGADVEKAHAEMLAKAKRYEDAKDYQRTYEPIHKGVHSESNVRVAYAENTMLPGNTGRKLITEEPSQHNAALVAMIDALPAGQDVLIQNAYVYLPAGLQVSLIRALKRGVNVTILSNSPESSDLGYIAQAARLQYREFLKLSAQSPGKIEIYEYLTEESLHAKVEVIGGRYLVVGSINADPRCEYLDTNNGVIIDSTALASRYKQWNAELRQKLLTRNPPLLRRVDDARIAQEDANQTPDGVTKIHRNFKPLAEKTFQDDAAGASARSFLQSVFLQY